MTTKPLFYAVCLWTALLLTGCGGSYDVHVPNVQVEHHLRLDDVEAYFRAYCEQTTGNVNLTERCVYENMGKFLAVFR